MSRINEYIELLANEGYRPKQTSDAELCFKSQGETFWLTIADDPSTFIMLHRVFQLNDDYDDISFLRMANNTNKAEYAIKCWINFEDRTFWVAFEAFYDSGTAFLSVLGTMLADMMRTSQAYFDDLEKYGVRVIDASPVDALSEGRQNGVHESVDTSDEDNGVRLIKEVSLMEPSSETDNKLRWGAKVGDATFNLYVPKWRVPEPWPRRIVVAISRPINQDLSSERVDISSSRSLDRKLRIATVVDRVRDHTRTARFRPRGNQGDWEIGEPYIPYSLLPDRLAQAVQIEVRWDLAGETWSD
jgi:hypothetical protein